MTGTVATGREVGGPVVGPGAPDLHPSLVTRPRLTDRLLASRPARLVVLTAPAGYSKTTSLAEWAAADERPFMWVAATTRDDDPARLIASIVEVLDELEPVDPDVTAALTGKPNISDIVLPRLARAVRDRSPFVLVVDDLQEVTSDDALEVLEVFLDALPRGAQLALASRREPPLPLGRMRAKRELVELSQAELALTRREAGKLLSNLGLELTGAQLGTIVDRTEAWPAAIYLAGLSLADRPNTAKAVAGFAGDHRIIADYLRDEFLATTSPSDLRFLTRTSVLEELTGELCDAVLKQPGSAETLRSLARSNALVVSLDRKDSRYRYHQLFAEELQAELHRREPEIERGLHSRASRWYSDNLDSDRAIDHAIAATETERAGELILLAYPEISGRGRLATLERWLERLGDERIASASTLAIAAANTCLDLGDGDGAAHWIRQAVAAADNCPDRLRGEVEAHIMLLEAMLGARGVVQMGADASRASELYPAESPWQSACYLFRGVTIHLTAHPERAIPLLKEAARRGAVVSPIIQGLALSQLCLITIEDGDRDTASRLIAQARAQVSRCGLADLPSMLMVWAASATVRADQGQVHDAREDLAQAMRLLPLNTDIASWYEAQARILLGRVLVRLGEPARARDLLREAERFLDHDPDAAILREWLKQSIADREAASTEGRAQEWSLTAAELRTLQYLPTHLSFREIGERIHVSPNTVKTQAQAVYRKLGASSRGEAVERARDAGLLRRDDPVRES